MVKEPTYTVRLNKHSPNRVVIMDQFSGRRMQVTYAMFHELVQMAVTHPDFANRPQMAQAYEMLQETFKGLGL